MKQRNPIAVLLLPFITLGIYSWYWLVKTKGEMNSLGEKIPTAWVWLIPFVGVIWWYYEYSKGVEHVTGEKINWIISFVLLWVLGCIGQAILQDSFNKVSAPVAASSTPAYQPPTVAATNDDSTNQNKPLVQ
ncbi:MAG: DUF4234 domain-containing protein [Candidatus Saccharibacteria bacterium]|nr:DUF4234 domain-containing protein [Candidatus Saccharibacteria bacterium]